MKHFDASGSNGTQLNCLTCEREIPEDTWFARLKVGERRAVFCRPQCAELFLDDPARYAWRIEHEQESNPPFLAESKSQVDDSRNLWRLSGDCFFKLPTDHLVREARHSLLSDLKISLAVGSDMVS